MDDFLLDNWSTINYISREDLPSNKYQKGSSSIRGTRSWEWVGMFLIVICNLREVCFWAFNHFRSSVLQNNLRCPFSWLQECWKRLIRLFLSMRLNHLIALAMADSLLGFLWSSYLFVAPLHRRSSRWGSCLRPPGSSWGPGLHEQGDTGHRSSSSRRRTTLKGWESTYFYPLTKL